MYENNQSRPRRPILEKWLAALTEEILLYDATHKQKAEEKATKQATKDGTD